MARDTNRKMTGKPCPGCSYEPQKHDYRSRILFRYEDGVCQDCEKTLAEHKAFAEAIEALPGWKTYTLPSDWFRLHVEGQGQWELGEEMNKALSNLVRLLLPVNAAATMALRENWNEPEIPRAKMQHSGRHGKRLFLPEGAPEVLEECRKLLAEALMENYQCGLEEGLDMVRGLQAGELTNAEFVKLATRKREKGAD